MARARSQKNAFLSKIWSSFCWESFLLIALPTLYLVLSGVGIWYFVKKAPDIRKRNLMIGLFIVSFVAVALQTQQSQRKLHLLSQKLSRL